MDQHLLEQLPKPPQWGMLVGSAGTWLIFLAIAAFFLVAVGAFLRREKLVQRSFVVGSSSLLLAFVALGVLMVGGQYQYRYVWAHTDNHIDLGYRIAAIWSGQEGSFLLWAVASAIFGLIVAPRTQHYRTAFTVAFSVFLLALAGILAFESPFKIQLIEGHLLMPPDGNGLTPSLINYWVKIHPPTIFLGFGSLTVLYSFAMAALVTRDFTNWVKIARPWIILCSTLLGIGLAMGGFWAYETLGWGGFWAWDPVENTSFVPWVWSLALLHGVFVQQTKNKWHGMNLVLAGTAFLSFVYGTFLTRSGYLGDTSVHSFAQMERHALQILIGVLVLSALAFVGLYLARRKSIPVAEPAEKGLTLERSYGWAAWLFLALGAAAAIGMSVPLITLITQGKQATVNEEVYNQVTTWMFIPMVLAMAIAPYLRWRPTSMKEVFDRVTYPLTASLVVVSLLIYWLKTLPAEFRVPAGALTTGLGKLGVPTLYWVFFLAWLCLFGICANIARIAQSVRRSPAGIGSFISHVGVITAMLGLVVSRGLQVKEQFTLQGDKPTQALGYSIRMAGRTADFYTRENKIKLELTDAKGRVTKATPTLYYVPAKGDQTEDQSVVRPAIEFRGLYDVYVNLGKMVFEVGDPVDLKKGQTMVVEESGYEVHYEKFRRDGEAGQTGTKFFADLLVKNPEGKVLRVSPGMQVTGEGPNFILADAGPYKIAMRRMEASDQSVTLELFYTDPVYPAEIYFKPLPILVWVGAGIMTIGGFWAAWYRRKSHVPAGAGTPDAPVASDRGSEDTQNNATIPVA
ncbi:MAG: cytochrome c biogenesis protein CcsA [Chthonomonas sp.]|nr:cytochrome c biogenesis protein CcsA [Chthonomonas sp.]